MKVPLIFKFEVAAIKTNINIFDKMKKILTNPPKSNINSAEILFNIKNIEKNFQKKQEYCVINCFQENFVIYPFYNAGLRRIDL